MKQMNFLEEAAKYTPRLRDNYPGRIYVFGASGQWREIYKMYKNIVNVDLLSDISAFVDNDPARQGTVFMGRPVIGPAEIDLKNAVVFIASYTFEMEIAAQLNELGLVEGQSFFFTVYLERIMKIFAYAQTTGFAGSVPGGRCFILGNGPSLFIEDLETLHKHNATCFAVNRIDRIFSKTLWRPTYYFSDDKSAFPETEILKKMRWPKFFAEYRADERIFDEYTYYYAVDAGVFFCEPPYKPRFSDSIEKLCAGGTIIYAVIQAAVNMGFDEIYLLGMNMEFAAEVLRDGTIVRRNVQSHFYPQQERLARDLDMVVASFACARAYCEAHGIKIRNATRGGKLEVFERIDFDSLF